MPGAYVSPEFFSVAGEPLLLGRGIAPGDEHAPVAVIGRRLWIERFGADPNIVTHALVLDGNSYTIVGVARGDFQLPSNTTDAWTPLGYAQDMGVAWLKNPRGGGVNLLGRLRAGVTLAHAESSLIAMAGSTAALATGWLGVHAVLWMTPADTPRLDAIRLDVPVFAFLLATAVCVAIVIAVAPAVRASRSDPATAPQRAARGVTSGPGARRFRSAVVVSEVAISVFVVSYATRGWNRPAPAPACRPRSRVCASHSPGAMGPPAPRET